MKTIKEWLTELDEPYRTQALNNLYDDNGDYYVDDISLAVSAAFVWSRNEQGVDYWADLAVKLNKR